MSGRSVTFLNNKMTLDEESHFIFYKGCLKHIEHMQTH